MTNATAKIQIEAISEVATKKTAHPMVKTDSHIRLQWIIDNKDLSDEIRDTAQEVQNDIEI